MLWHAILSLMLGAAHGFVGISHTRPLRSTARHTLLAATRTNYYNTLKQADKLDQLARCRFMDRSEFASGIDVIAGKKVAVVL